MTPTAANSSASSTQRRPKISVLVPSYNYAGGIGRCIESVLAQTHPSFELVISDDASTDASDQVIRSYRDSRIRYERQGKNLGMVPNWRKCVELSRGEYLLLLGQDDYLLPDMLRRTAAALDADAEVAMCHTATEFFTDEGRVIATTGAFQRSYVRQGVDLLESFVSGRRMVSSSSLFRRSCWEELGGWSSDFKNCMDIDLWFRMLPRWRIAYVGKILVGFRWHDVSTEWKIMQSQEDQRFICAMMDRLPQTHAHLRELKPALLASARAHWYRALKQVPPSPERDEALARLDQGDGAAAYARGLAIGMRSQLRNRGTVWLAQLPDELRYRIGDYLGVAV